MGIMRERKRSIAITTSLCLVLSIAAAGLEGMTAFAAEESVDKIGAEHASDEVIVIFEENVNKSDVSEVADDMGAESAKVITETNDEITAVVTLPEEDTVEEAIRDYQTNEDVAYVQPNYRYTLADAEEEPLETTQAATEPETTETTTVEEPSEPEATEDESTQESQPVNKVEEAEISADPISPWYHTKIKTKTAWARLNTVVPRSPKVRVAVLDMGIDYNHEDIQANLNKSLCKDVTLSRISNIKSSSDDLYGHGTHVAGIIGATYNNAKGSTGVASGDNNDLIELFVVDVFNGEYAYTDAIIRGINYAGSNGAKVINMSLGYPTDEPKNNVDKALETAINRVTAKGISVVCASGNDRNTVTNYPADFGNSISVIATNMSDKKASFSNYGKLKDISAPGESIYSTIYPNKYQHMSGTSMAAPIVAGTAAMLYAANPRLNAAEVKSILYTTATDIYTKGRDQYSGYGIVNADKAVAKAIALRSVSSVKVNTTAIKRGTASTITATVTPRSALVGSLVWESLTPDIATITPAGTVTGLKLGYAKVRVTATSKDGTVKTATGVITIGYSINYVMNGGKNSTANPKVYYNRTVIFKAPTRKGYAFKGWYIDSKMTRRITRISAGDRVYYAKWSKLNVAKASVKKLTKPSSRKMTIRLNKISGVKGYEINYSTSKNFTKNTTKTSTIKGTKTTLKNLKKNKRYYVRVRAYKIDSAGKKVYGKYSKRKSKWI